MSIQSIVSRSSDLLGFSLTARSVGQRIALGTYLLMSMADHVVRKKLRLTRRRVPHALLTDVVVKTNWGSFHCRNRTSDGWIAGPLFEPTTCQYIKRTTTHGVFVDVGSHIGRYTVEMARHLRNDGQVVAFEPHPDTFAALKRNIDLNRLTNVVALNFGCWSHSGTLPMVGKDDMAMISTGGAPKGGQLVRVVTLDEALIDRLQLAEISTLKIDVEGGEEHVLAGATRVIHDNPSMTILFEALDKSALEQVCALLRPSGFTIERLSWKNFVASRKRPFPSGTRLMH